MSHLPRNFVDNRTPVSVKDYGAVGNGIANDTTAIQAAFNSGATHVYFPAGIYAVSSGLTVSSTETNPLIISGDGYDSHIISTIPGTDTVALAASGSTFSDFTIRDLRISGTFSRGINLTANSGHNVRVERCKISGATAFSSGVTIASIGFGNLDDVWIVDNEISGDGYDNGDGTGQGYSIINYNGTTHYRIHVIGNRISSYRTLISICLFDVADSEILNNSVNQGNTGALVGGFYEFGYGILIYDTVPVTNDNRRNLVSGNNVTNCAGMGIYFTTQYDSVISDNIVLDTCKKINETSLPHAGISANLGNTTITGNVVKTVTTPSHGISFTSAGCVVTGNYVEDASSSVNIQGNVDRATISGNSFVNTVHGILVNGVTLSGIVISNNSMTNVLAPLSVQPGGSLSESTFSHNTTSGAQVGVLLSAGINNRIIGNLFSDGSSYAVQIASGANNQIISDNTVVDQSVGFLINSNNCHITNNDLSDVSGTPLTISGTGHIQISNRVDGYGTLVLKSGTGSPSDNEFEIWRGATKLIESTSGNVTINGKLTVTGLIDPTGLVLNEQSSIPTPATSGKGIIWVDSTTSPNRLAFTNESNGTTYLSGAGTANNLTTVLSNGNTTDGFNIYVNGTDAILFGAAPAATGTIRLSNTQTLNWRNSTDAADIVAFQVYSDNSIYVGDYTNISISNRLAAAGLFIVGDSNSLIRQQISSTTASWGVPNHQWFEFVASPAISQSPKTSDQTPQNITITPQAPFASATGTNRNPANLVVDLSTPTNGGTAEGSLKVTRATSFVGSIGAYPTLPTTYSGLWLGPGLTPNTANYTVLSNGDTLTLLGVTNIAGTVRLTVAGGSVTDVTATTFSFTSPPTVQWPAAIVSPKLYQVDDSTNSITGDTLTIQAQNATGTTTTGGALKLQSGTGTSLDGYVRVFIGTNERATFSDEVLSLYATNGLFVDGLAFQFAKDNGEKSISIETQTNDVGSNNLQIKGQDAVAGTRNGGNVRIQGGTSSGGTGGSVALRDSGGVSVIEVGSSQSLGFFNGGITTKQTVTGSRLGSPALASLLSALAAYGLITDSTSA